jgi:hypothetical protein
MVFRLLKDKAFQNHDIFDPLVDRIRKKCEYTILDEINWFFDFEIYGAAMILFHDFQHKPIYILSMLYL